MYFVVIKSTIKRTLFGSRYVYLYLHVDEKFRRSWVKDITKATRYLDKEWAERNAISIDESAVAHRYI